MSYIGAFILLFAVLVFVGAWFIPLMLEHKDWFRPRQWPGKLHAWWDYRFQFCLYHRGHIRDAAIRHNRLGELRGQRTACRLLKADLDHQIDWLGEVLAEELNKDGESGLGV